MASAAMGASGVYGDCRICAAIVGYADLRFGDQVGELLDRALAIAPDRFRGVRQITIEHPSDAPFRYVTNPPPPGLDEASGVSVAAASSWPRGPALRRSRLPPPNG